MSVFKMSGQFTGGCNIGGGGAQKSEGIFIYQGEVRVC